MPGGGEPALAWARSPACEARSRRSVDGTRSLQRPENAWSQAEPGRAPGAGLVLAWAAPMFNQSSSSWTAAVAARGLRRRPRRARGHRRRSSAAPSLPRRLSAELSVSPGAVRPDLRQPREHRLLLAAVGDLPLELLGGRQAGQRTVLAFGLGDVHEADTVLELEGHVAEARGGRAVQLLVHRADQFLVALHMVGLQSVANQYSSHRLPPSLITRSGMPALASGRRSAPSPADDRAASRQRSPQPPPVLRPPRGQGRIRRRTPAARRSCPPRRIPPPRRRSRTRHPARASSCWFRPPCRQPPAIPLRARRPGRTEAPARGRCRRTPSRRPAASTPDPGWRSARSRSPPPPGSPSR